MSNDSELLKKEITVSQAKKLAIEKTCTKLVSEIPVNKIRLSTLFVGDTIEEVRTEIEKALDQIVAGVVDRVDAKGQIIGQTKIHLSNTILKRFTILQIILYRMKFSSSVSVVKFSNRVHETLSLLKKMKAFASSFADSDHELRFGAGQSIGGSGLDLTVKMRRSSSKPWYKISKNIIEAKSRNDSKDYNHAFYGGSELPA